MNYDDTFNNLRSKLNALGYKQLLHCSSVALVAAIFEDLVRTTESLRDAKFKISQLLEEKSCWELGIEPYKCDNSRLLEECNATHMALIKQREQYEKKLIESAQKVRNLELDNKRLEEHSIQLEHQIRELASKFSDLKPVKYKKDGTSMSKKPFISTVRGGDLLPNPYPEHASTYKCYQCSNPKAVPSGSAKKVIEDNYEQMQMENEIKKKSEQISFLKKKIDARDREIQRLTDLLSGGRPPTALVDNCCYKNVGLLSEDVEILQQEKIELQKRQKDSEELMHEARKRAMYLDEKNRKLEKEIRFIEKTAVNLESQANVSIIEKDQEIDELRTEIKRLNEEIFNLQTEPMIYRKPPPITAPNQNPDLRKTLKNAIEEKKGLIEKLNALTVKEQEHVVEIDKLNKKNTKLKSKISAMETDYSDIRRLADKTALTAAEEDIIKAKTERDFYQKEFMKLIEKKTSSRKTFQDTECLKSQLSFKDDEIRKLRSEISQLRCQMSVIDRQRVDTPSGCPQSAIIHIERERDILNQELKIVQRECEELRNKLQYSSSSRYDGQKRLEDEIHELRLKNTRLERENKELGTNHYSKQTHAVLMKEEMEELRKRVIELETENSKLKSTYNTLKILHDQTEHSLVEHQNRLCVAETHLENAEMRLNALNTDRDSSRNDIDMLKNEIVALKTEVMKLDREKDKLIEELDTKTENLYKLEANLKSVSSKKQELDRICKGLREKLDGLTSESREKQNELHETSTESKQLRLEMATLKALKDKILTENGQLTNEVTDTKAEMNLLKRKLRDSEKEVERLKQQLQQYVTEVQRAEKLLSSKENEREEMLEHYRTLSHDVVLLEGNNHSLELEAGEQKKMLLDAELAVKKLKDEILEKDMQIDKFDRQVNTLSTQIEEMQNELEQANDEQRVLKVDISAMKELCNKLDLQRDKLNAELEEAGKIRNQLERENERLRKELSNFRSGDKATLESLQELLAQNRQELDEQRRIAGQHRQDVSKLKEDISSLKTQLSAAKAKAARNEALAQEYDLKIQELRHNMTNERFEIARSREEESPRIMIMVDKEVKNLDLNVKLNENCLETSKLSQEEPKTSQILKKKTKLSKNKGNIVDRIEKYLCKSKDKKKKSNSIEDSAIDKISIETTSSQNENSQSKSDKISEILIPNIIPVIYHENCDISISEKDNSVQNENSKAKTTNVGSQIKSTESVNTDWETPRSEISTSSEKLDENLYSLKTINSRIEKGLGTSNFQRNEAFNSSNSTEGSSEHIFSEKSADSTKKENTIFRGNPKGCQTRIDKKNVQFSCIEQRVDKYRSMFTDGCDCMKKP